MGTPIVLVVEDEALIRMNLTDILASAGCQTREASNAEKALKILEGDPSVNALFTDVNMPGEMDGLGLAQYVSKRWPDIRIIISSAYGIPNEGAMPSRSQFFGKPIRNADMIQVADELCGQEKS